MGAICSCFKGKEKEEGIKDIKRNRSCTDAIFCLAFLVSLLVAIVIIFVGMANGNIESLYYGTDATGMTCGSSNNNQADKVDLSAKKFIVYPRLQEDMVRQSTLNPTTDYNDYKFYGICVESCPTAGSWICTEKGVALKKTDADREACKTVAGGGAFLADYNYPAAHTHCAALMTECHYQAFDTQDIFFRCINLYPDGTSGLVRKCADPVTVDFDDPKCIKVSTNSTTINGVSTNVEDVIAKQLTSTAAFALRTFGDVQKASTVIFIAGGAGALVIGVLWLLLMRYTAKCLVWTTVLLALISCLGFTMICWVKAGFIALPNEVTNVAASASDADIQSQLAADEESKLVWTGAAYISSVISLIFLIVVTFLWRKIALAAAIISEASTAVASMPLIVFFPVPIMTILLAWFGIWLWGMGNLWTMGAISANDLNEAAGISNTTVSANSIKEFKESELKNYLMIIHTFLGLWVMNFVQGISTMTICGAFAGWYWTVPSNEPSSSVCCGKKHVYLHRVQKKADGETVEKRPVLASFIRTVRYHLGSVALGSLIIAIVQFLRIVMEYINRQTKGLQKKSCIIRAAMCCIRCCLWCFEKCVKYITRSAYIIIAAQGKSFCSATFTVFHILLKHTTTIGVATVVSSFVILLGKLVITAGCTIIAYLWMSSGAEFQKGGVNELNSSILPLVFVAILGYCIGAVFLGVYDMGIETIIVSFCIDKDENKEGGYMFPPSLAKAIGMKGKTRTAETEAANENKGETTSSYKLPEDDQKPEQQASDGDFI